METKKYLQQYRRIYTDLNSGAKKLEALLEKAAGGSRNAAGKIAALREALAEKFQLADGLLRQMENALDGLDCKEENLVLSYRYILGWNWPAIATEMNVSERSVRRWHRDGLEHLAAPDAPVFQKSKFCEPI